MTPTAAPPKTSAAVRRECCRLGKAFKPNDMVRRLANATGCRTTMDVIVWPMATGRRGLVLGGGGVTGIAWETGLLAGLAQAGVDLVAADVVVGTSGGSGGAAPLLRGIPPRDTS